MPEPLRYSALALIKALDGGCDNVRGLGSAYQSLYWGAVTQCPIIIGNNTLPGDIVLPDLKIINEPDGRTKFGDNGRRYENTGKWLSRQHDLLMRAESDPRTLARH